LGMTFVIMTGGIDLSVGSLVALSAALGISALNFVIGQGSSEALGVVTAVATCLLAGASLGAFNGLLVGYLRIPPFMATLAGLVGFRSFALALADGGEIRSASHTLFPMLAHEGISLPFITTSSSAPLLIGWNILILLVLTIVTDLLVRNTVIGRWALAVGGNEEAALYSGIPVKFIKWTAYTFAGLLTGVSALLLASRMNSVSTSDLGRLYELDAIAAVVLGGTPLSGGYGRVWGTLVGVLLMGLITNLLILANVSVYWQGAVKGAIILVAVASQTSTTKR
ncbi:MAG: ABC transporter permease, partial [Candidatus Caldarchaeum sp.]